MLYRELVTTGAAILVVVSVAAVVWEVVVVPMQCEFADSLQARLDSDLHV
jgi:hypothetical protein